MIAWRGWFLGLRARLLLAFVIVALLSGTATAGASYVTARRTTLADAQSQILLQTRDRLDALAPTISRRPSQVELDDLVSRLKEELPGRVAATYRSMQAPSVVLAAETRAPDVPVALRRSVSATGHFMWQRIEFNGRPFLVSGTPMKDDRGQLSGLVIYVLSDLDRLQKSLDALGRSTIPIMVVCLLAAALLALLAARGVLRPVRDLRHGVRVLAAGEFHTRLRVRGSDELADLARTFNDTATTLESTVGELRRMEANAQRFVADVSHELRTPLAAMTAVTDTLDEEATRFGGDAAAAVRLVSAEIQRLGHLVENLIDISRFDAGRAVLRREDDVDVAELVAATLAARGWTDQVEVAAPTRISASVDRSRVDVIVANVVGNALQHGAPPVNVAIAQTIGIDGQSDVAVEVTDHGSGVAPEIIPNLFDRFYKADAARGRTEGSGLGLAIAQENARLHGGTIEVEASGDVGATFTIHLPGVSPEDR